MINILRIFVCNLLLLLFFSSSVFASDITINGSADFKCSFISNYMEKHGYSFIEEALHNNSVKTNLFGAKDAEVTIENQQNIVIGVGKTDSKGKFSISVPKEASYKVTVKFHGNEYSKAISDSDTSNITAHFGFFTSDKVGDWIDSSLDW